MPGSSSQYSSRSLGVRSAVLPTDTKPLTPSEGPVSKVSAASPSPPDCVTNASRPGGGKARLKVALNRGSGPPLSSPIQLGPMSRTLAARARRRRSSCRARPAPPASANPRHRFPARRSWRARPPPSPVPRTPGPAPRAGPASPHRSWAHPRPAAAPRRAVTGFPGKHQDPGRVSCPALIPRHTHHPPRRDGLGSRDDPRRMTGPRDGHVTGTVGRQMSQAGEPAPGAGIQAAPQRLDPRGVITAQRPEHHHPAITQRLLPNRGAAGSHDPPQGRSWPGHAFTGPAWPTDPSPNAGRGACLARAGTPGDRLAPTPARASLAPAAAAPDTARPRR